VLYVLAVQSIKFKSYWDVEYSESQKMKLLSVSSLLLDYVLDHYNKTEY